VQYRAGHETELNSTGSMLLSWEEECNRRPQRMNRAVQDKTAHSKRALKNKKYPDKPPRLHFRHRIQSMSKYSDGFQQIKWSLVSCVAGSWNTIEQDNQGNYTSYLRSQVLSSCRHTTMFKTKDLFIYAELRFCNMGYTNCS
jgi:hypothetical protein